MRLVTFRSDTGQPHVGVLRGDNIVDLSVLLGPSARPDLSSALGMLYLIRLGEQGLGHVREALEADEGALQATGALLPLDTSRLLAPIPRPLKNVICLGRNYPEHARESARAFGEEPPKPQPYPIVFSKTTTSVNGPYSDIPYDASITEQLDWEVELAVIIGKAGKKISRDNALDHVFGYTVLNDISARDIQARHGGQFFLGKSLDGSCPIGPWIVTPDEIPDPDSLDLWTLVNGVEKQRSNTREMTFDVSAIIEITSSVMTLEPGDIIATGTPDGIGHARTPPEYLHPGDVVECGVEGIGVIRNRISDDRR
jgi:2-keto-4-pentenoate hydratase/2-oxohepta-3-ene-1,7-dioic acid hydratase in catechol pathway